MNAPTSLSAERPEKYATDETRWEAVVRKDHAADGRFYYSVKTTGVYCLPSCPARTALRKNVVFHQSPAAAEKAGFRACKRCLPNGPRLNEIHAAAVAKACRAIETSEHVPTLEVLARTAGMSAFHFHRVFKAITGVTPKAYATAHRARRIREELTKGESVTEAIYSAGYGSNGRFYAQAAETLGMAPSRYQKGGAGMEIRFTVGKCTLGFVLVAASEKGVCAVSLGDDAEALTQELQDRFSRAQLIAGDQGFERLVTQVIGFIEEPKGSLDLPLDVRGTAFQHKVWQALRKIPAGRTLSYTDIAAQIGTPRAVRAVAHACASNPIAIAIPCHRVVRQDGNLAGYRWGLERKRALLKREAGK